MDRTGRGYNPRLSTPGRSPLGNENWYNKMYESAWEENTQQIRSQQQKRQADYRNTNFGNFAEAYGFDDAQFLNDSLQKIIKGDEHINEIPEIEISNVPEKTRKELDEERRVLKEKKYIEGLKGNDLSREDTLKLAELDLWHRLTYDDGFTTIALAKLAEDNKSPQQLAIEEAERRLANLNGAPEGYWGRTARRLLDTVTGAATGALLGAKVGAAAGTVLGPYGTIGGGILGAAAGMFFMPNSRQNEPGEKSNLIDDITTSFTRKANEIQVGTSKGKIQRVQEMQLLGQNGLEELLDVMQYRDNLKSQISQLEAKRLQKTATDGDIANLQKLQKQYDDSYMMELHASDKLDKLASYEPNQNLGGLSYMWNMFNRALDVDYGKTLFGDSVGEYANKVDFAYDLGVSNDLLGLKQDLRDFRDGRNRNNPAKYNGALERIRHKIDTFNKNTGNRIKGWQEDIAGDEKDIERIDNNYKISDYYQLNDIVAQNLGIFSPRKILFSSAGLLGSSMSSTPKTLLKLLSYGFAMAGMPQMAIPINVISGGAQAADENNAEVGLTFEPQDFVKRMYSAGVYQDFLEDGRRQLGNKDASAEDIIDAFTKGKIMFSKRNVREAMLNIIGGANQQWAYDMNATAPGIWTEALLTTVPDAWFIKGARAIGTATRPFRKLAQEVAGMNELAAAESLAIRQAMPQIEEMAAKKGIKDYIVASAAGQKVANAWEGSMLARTTDKLRDKFATVSKLGKYIPTKFIFGVTGKPFRRAAKSLAARSIIGSSQEFWEEDVQSIRQHQRAKGEFGNEYLSGELNIPLWYDNFADGIRSSWDFIWKDPMLATQEEKEIWREAKLGALGFMLQGGIPVFVQSASGTWKQYKSNDLLLSHLLQTKAEDDAKIQKGQFFAQHVRTPEETARFLRAFDDIIAANKKKVQASQKNNDVDGEGFPEEALLAERDYFMQVANTYRNPATRQLLEDAGYTEGSEDYNIALALLARQKELAFDAADRSAQEFESLDRIKAVLKSNPRWQEYVKNHSITFKQPARKPEEIPTPQGKLGGQKKAQLEQQRQQAIEAAKEQDKQDEAAFWAAQKEQYDQMVDDMFYLGAFGALIESINQHQIIENISGKKLDYLNQLKKKLGQLNQKRKEEGYIQLNTEDDVLQLVQDQDMYEMAKNLTRKLHGFQQDAAAANGVVKRLLSVEHIHTGEKAEEVYPIVKAVEKYKENRNSDIKLQEDIENDYFDLVRRQEEIDDFIEESNIGNQNNIYMGYDGKTYIVIPSVTEDGEFIYKKYLYSEEGDMPVGKAMPFDKEEFFLSKKADEHDAEREQSSEISDDERVELGNKRIAREERQRRYAIAQEADRLAYSEGEVQDESAQEYADRILREREIADAAKQWQESQPVGEQEESSQEYADRVLQEREETDAARKAEREENERLRQEPQDKLHQLYNDGYEFVEEKTKRGKTVYYAKKGKSKVRLTEEEYNEGFNIQIEKSRKIGQLEYDPRLSTPASSLAGRDDAYVSVEARILKAVYDGNEQMFNDLLDYFSVVLTDEQIEDLRYMWLAINDYIAEERQISRPEDEDSETAEEKALKIRRAIRGKLADFKFVMFNTMSIANSIDQNWLADLVDKFAEEQGKQKGLVKKRLLDTKGGQTKAMQLMVMAKSKFHIYRTKKNYIAQDPEGGQYTITDEQYRFYEYLKQNSPRAIQLEFQFEDEVDPRKLLDDLMRGIQLLIQAGIIKQNIEEAIAQSGVIPGVHIGEETLDALRMEAIRERDAERYAQFKRLKKTVGSGELSVQDAKIRDIKRYAKDKDTRVLNEYTNGTHYFILNDDGKIIPYRRVHFNNDFIRLKAQSANEYFARISENIIKYNEIRSKLLSLRDIQHKGQMIDYIKQIQDEYNQNMTALFGKNDNELVFNLINLEGYVKFLEDNDQFFTDQADDFWVDEIFSSIAHLASNIKPSKFYLAAGTYIDEIVRFVLSGKPVFNHPKYRMKDETFNKLCNQIEQKKRVLERIGIKLVTDEIVLRGWIDGVPVAGTTDAIGVDEQGRVYIIDFKTTSGYKKYKKGDDSIINVDRRRYSPEESREINKSEDFVAEFDREQLITYKDQLATYDWLYYDTFDGEEADGVFIAPIYVERYDETGGKDGFKLGRIDRAEVLKPFRLDLEVENEPEIDWTEVDNAVSSMDDMFSKTQQALSKHVSDLRVIDGRLQLDYIDIKNQISAVKQVIDAEKNGSGTVPVETILSKVQSIIQKIQEFNQKAKEIYKPKPSAAPPIQPPTGGHKFNPSLREATGLLYRYNNVDLERLKFLKKAQIQALARISALPDFIENSVWELNVGAYLRNMGTLMMSERSISKPNIVFSIKYDEHLQNGSVIHHSFDNLLIQAATTDSSGKPYTHIRRENPLLRTIDSILFDRKENGDLVQKKDASNKKIIFVNKSRTNGIILTDNNQSTLPSIVDVFGIKPEQIESLISKDGNEIGVVGVTTHGQLGYIKKPGEKNREIIYGIEEDRAMTDGQISIALTLPYTEDNGMARHTPIIPFTAKFFTPNDVDFLVNLIQNFGKYQNKSFEITIDGNKYKSPLTAHQILYNLMIRFGSGAEQTGNQFVLNFGEKPDGSTDFTTIRASEWGTGNPIYFDLKTNEGVSNFKAYLNEGASVWYQNEDMLTAGTTSKLDTTPNNPFAGIEQFFKDHPEVNQIKYSDSLVFDRIDVDPDGDGSYSGIHGFTWAVKHGWMTTNYTSMALPLMSAESVQEVKPVPQPDPEDKPIVPSAPSEPKKPIQPIGNPSIENPLEDFDISSMSAEVEGTWDEISQMLNNLGGLNKLQSKSQRSTLDREQAERRLRRILGKKFPVRFIESVVRTFADGSESVGVLTRSGITLSQYAQNGVEFHEAFHAIVELLLPEYARKKLYEHYREQYLNGKKASQRTIAEGLADLYYDFKQGTPEVRFTWNILKTLKNIRDYVNALRSLNDVKIALLFAATDAGVMRAFNITETKQRKLEQRFGKGLYFTVTDSDGKQHNFTNFANFRTIDDFVNVFTYKLINNAGIDLLGKNINTLDTRLGAIQTTLFATPEEKDQMQKEHQKLSSKYGNTRAWDYVSHSKEYKKLTLEGATEEQLNQLLTAIGPNGKPIMSPLAVRNIKLFREAFNDWEFFRGLIEAKLKSFGVDKVREREERVRDEVESTQPRDQEEFGHYDTPFYEHSMKDDVPTKIRYFLSTRPNRKFADADDVRQGRVASMYRMNPKGERERIYLDIKNNSMGYSTYMPYNQVYNTMLRLCHSARSIDELDRLTEQLGKSDYLMYNIHKAYHRFRFLMYNRWDGHDLGGQYQNKVKVLIRSNKDSLKTEKRDNMTLLHPDEYTSTEMPTVVRYSHDIVNGAGEVIHKQGDIIQEAIIFTNPDYEQLVSQLFQAVRAQRLNFTNIYSVSEVTQYGRPTGRYSYEAQPMSSDYDTTRYPRIWFNSLRSGFGGIFNQVDGNIQVAVNEDGSTITVFGDTAKKLRNIRNAISATRGKINVNNIPIDGQYKDLYNDDDFADIEIEVVRLLNDVGVSIDIATLNYALLVKHPGVTLQESFRRIFTSTDVNSISPFIDEGGVLDTLQKALDDKRYNVFFEDVAPITGKAEGYNRSASGFEIYGNSGFLIDLAKMVGQYKLANKEAMQIGPNNTKLYTYAQHHQASFTVEQMNHLFDENGNRLQNTILTDMEQSPYVVSEDGTGSIIAETLNNKDFNPEHNKIQLATFEGVRLNVSRSGGNKYSEISSREDWLSKASILQDGNIIFPTLSDKSTWFYLVGFVLPGIDYKNIRTSALPKFSNTSYSRIFFDKNDFDAKSPRQYYSKENDVIDRIIKYAYLELAFINKNINALGLQDSNLTDHRLKDSEKIANFHTGTMNGCRFALLTGIYGRYNEETGDLDETKDEFYSFNKYDPNNPEKSVLDSREHAMRAFFDKHKDETDAQLRARQRSMIANMLQHRVKDQLEDLVKKGIIQKVDPRESRVYKRNGSPVYDTRISDFFGYKNVFLDHKIIDRLKQEYQAMPIGDKTYSDLYTQQQIESAAISAYVWDITAKSIISKEETQRFFTGFPHFFKWKFDKDTGDLIDITEDESKRHGGQGSTGTSNILDLPNVREVYRAAELKDQIVKSPIVNSLRRGFASGMYRDKLIELLIDELPTNTTVEGENIFSGGSEFAKQLTNPKNNLAVTLDGVTYRNAEHAYQSLKSGQFNKEAYERFPGKPLGNQTDRSSNFDLMVRILTAKLNQHPELISGITDRGGLLYLAKSRHIVPQSMDRYFQSNGQNRFIAALTIAYNNIINQQEVSQLPYTEDDADATNRLLQDTKNQARVNKQSLLDTRIDEIYDSVGNMSDAEVEYQLSQLNDGEYTKAIDKNADEFVSGFNKVNVTDGTAYITDTMAEQLLRMRGAWDSDVKDAFAILRKGSRDRITGKYKHLSRIEAYKLIVNALIGAQKYSAFGYRMQYGLPVHFYNKYALFPLFKGINYGFTSILYDKMTDPENGVDMVMMESAVKVGQQGGQKFNPDMTEEELKNFSFKDHIYELPFNSVRRQLNTDPHERDFMQMGTQAAKVALSVIQDNQQYQMPDGSYMRGRDVKNMIMTAIKELSKIGVNKINDQFFDIEYDADGKQVSKKLNIDKFTGFLEKELMSRNADKNILDAVRQLRSTKAPVLNAVSNMAWVESILVSVINKNVIDINLPGNAFYQRSVFGMEGLLGDDERPVLANGKPLQMINEEGSMDAAVSLDFFYNILPKNLWYNFEKAEQWLIDNDIISGVKSTGTEWHNAKANIMAYRIPTQAVSSIHAIRIVAVLPDVRDTVVLPKEFTAITGSDFDIDKLYMSMKNYDVVGDTVLEDTMGDYEYEHLFNLGESDIIGGFPIRKAMRQKKEYIATDKFDKGKNPEGYYQNQLMDLYLMLLKQQSLEKDKSVNYVHQLQKPVDTDTDLVHGVLDKLESKNKKTPVEPFVAGSLYFQSNKKSSFISGKFGIGPFALNNNNHILTMLYDVSFKNSPTSIMSLLNADSLHERNDRDGNSILSWISALINSHVDAAKDPFIFRMNVNKYTYNMINLLLRTGFGEDAFFFINQPIMKDLADEFLNAQGDIVSDPNMSQTDRKNELEQRIAMSYEYGADGILKSINKLFGKGGVKWQASDFERDSEVFKALFGVTENGYDSSKKTLLEDLITNDEYLIDPNQPVTVQNMKMDEIIQIGKEKYSPRQLQGYVFIAKKLFDEYADALGDMVQSTKIDTKNHGINYMEQKRYKDRYNELKKYDENLFDNLRPMLEESFIDYKTNNAIDLLKDILGEQMIHFTDQFFSIQDKIAQIMNARSDDSMRAIQNSMLAYIKQKCMNAVMEDLNTDFNSLIRGTNSLSNRIEALKHKMLANPTGEYSFFVSNGVFTNSILANITPVPYIHQYGQDQYDLLLLDNSIDEDQDIQNDYIDSWEQMWQSNDDEIKGIARDLAIYAFMTSADTRGISKFFKYVPMSLRNEIGYVDRMVNAYNMFNDKIMQLNTEGSEPSTININEFIKNNWRDNNIVREFKPGKTQIEGKTFAYNDINKVNGQVIFRDALQIFALKTARVNKTTGMFAPYIKMRRPYASTRDVDPYLLYKMIAVGRYGESEYPIYALSNAKGVSIRTGANIIDMYEYERDDQNSHITTGYQLDDFDWSNYITKIERRMRDYIKANPNMPQNKVEDYVFNKPALGNNPVTNQPMVSESAVYDASGESIVAKAQIPSAYIDILRGAYNQEVVYNMYKEQKPRWSDQFKKYCKDVA